MRARRDGIMANEWCHNGPSPVEESGCRSWSLPPSTDPHNALNPTLRALIAPFAAIAVWILSA